MFERSNRAIARFIVCHQTLSVRCHRALRDGGMLCSKQGLSGESGFCRYGTYKPKGSHGQWVTAPLFRARVPRKGHSYVFCNSCKTIDEEERP